MVKVDIISGFLGARKTTLIKNLFKSSMKNEKVVLKSKKSILDAFVVPLSATFLRL